jgi:hypothetical protein
MGDPKKAQMLLEEMRWKYAGGPLPTHRRRKRQRSAALGCTWRLLVAFAFCVAVLVAAKVILF